MSHSEEYKQENDTYLNVKREVMNMSDDELYAELNSVNNILDHSTSLIHEFGVNMSELQEQLNKINSDYKLKRNIIISELTIRKLPTHYIRVL